MLNTVLVRRRADVAPTESYAETRAVQLLRSWDITPWRQIAVARHGRVMFRADFMIPFRPGSRRPDVVGPGDGVLVEIDGREFHDNDNDFERDQRRNATYNELGYHWVSFTPHQIEHDPQQVRRALDGATRRAGQSL